MSNTVRKAAFIAAWSAAIGRLYGREDRSPLRWCIRWTPPIAAAAVAGAFFFVWAFLRIVLFLVFPRPPAP